MTKNDLYLNHAGTSWPKPQVVSDAVHHAMAMSPTRWPRRFDEAHEAIAEFFGVSRREQILLTPGCTSALSVGIEDAHIASGQRILTSCWEHHALHRPLLKTASTGVRLDYIPRGNKTSDDGHTPPMDLDWLEDALSKGDVGMVAITAASNVTGEQLPYEDVVRIAKRYGAMVLIDAAQIVGWQKLDLPKLGADMVAFGGHKGLQSPWGIGGLYLSDQAVMECVSASCALPTAGLSGQRQAGRPGYCDVGSVDQIALAGLHASVQMLAGLDLDVALAGGRRQVRRLRESLARFEHVRIVGPSDVERGMPTLALEVSGSSSNDVASLLKRHQLIVGSGLQCAPLAHQTLGTESAGLVRLSVGLRQPDQEIDEAINRLQCAFDDLPSLER